MKYGDIKNEKLLNIPLPYLMALVAVVAVVFLTKVVVGFQEEPTVGNCFDESGKSMIGYVPLGVGLGCVKESDYQDRIREAIKTLPSKP